MSVNLSLITLEGSLQSYHKSETLYSLFELSTDNEKMSKYVLDWCWQNSTCSNDFVSDDKILNLFFSIYRISISNET